MRCSPPCCLRSTEQRPDLVRRLGDRLGQEGYRGFFEVDVLIDVNTDDVYLGELNPRISGASSITNVTAGAYADIPLFLFYLLEFMDVDFAIDVDEIDARWGLLAAEDQWSQMVLKETESITERLDATPRTGQSFLDEEGTLQFRRAALDWHQLQGRIALLLLANPWPRRLSLEGRGSRRRGGQGSVGRRLPRIPTADRHS